MVRFAAPGQEPVRTPPAALVAEAARRPGGWVAELDRALIGDPDGYIPAEAIRGAWKVDDAGQLTGEFQPNARYGPPQDDFTKLFSTDHFLQWLGHDPAATIRESVAEVVDEQVPGAAVRWMKITDEPRFLTAGRRDADDPDSLIVTRAALAAAFASGSMHPRDPTRSYGGSTASRSSDSTVVSRHAAGRGSTSGPGWTRQNSSSSLALATSTRRPDKAQDRL